VKPARERAAADPIASADQDWQVRLRGGVDLAPDIVSRRLTAEARRQVDRVADEGEHPGLPQLLTREHEGGIQRQRLRGPAVAGPAVGDVRGDRVAATVAPATVPHEAHTRVACVRLRKDGECGETIVLHDDEPLGFGKERDRRAMPGGGLMIEICVHVNALSSLSVTLCPIRTWLPMNAPLLSRIIFALSSVSSSVATLISVAARDITVADWINVERAHLEQPAGQDQRAAPPHVDRAV